MKTTEPTATICRYRVKSVEWAMPHSNNSAKFGRARNGCWCVQVGWSGEPLVAITGHVSREAALQHAHSLATEWDSSFAAIYPDDVARFKPFRFAPITNA